MQAISQLVVLSCSICFENPKKPRMCPACSKIACQDCYIQRRREDNQVECSICRKIGKIDNFISCQRFLTDIKSALEQMNKKKEKPKEKCLEHDLQINYFCQTCKQPICSDCGMFGVKHREHRVIHLKKVYEQKKRKVLLQMPKFNEKIDQFRDVSELLKLELQKLSFEKLQNKKFIEQYFINTLEKLHIQFLEKQQRLTYRLNENNKEIEGMQNFRQNLCTDIQSLSNNQLIFKASDFVNYIQVANEEISVTTATLSPNDFQFDTIDQISPKYNQFRFLMKDFNQINENLIYSQPYSNNGLQWRLKIYPRGNGLAKDIYMSVFLQMTKGFISGNKYQYKIELVNHRNPSQSIIRQYNSNFDIGQCWGYNQFVPLNELGNGYFNEKGQMEYVVEVKNPSYRSLIRDQKAYISFLQSQLKKKQEINENNESERKSIEFTTGAGQSSRLRKRHQSKNERRIRKNKNGDESKQQKKEIDYQIKRREREKSNLANSSVLSKIRGFTRRYDTQGQSKEDLEIDADNEIEDAELEGQYQRASINKLQPIQ